MSNVLSGVTRVPTAGTAVSLGSQVVNGSLTIKALTTNTGLVYIGNDGANSVSSANGLPLLAGEVAVFVFVGNLSGLFLNSAVNNEGVSWIVLNAGG